MVATTGTRAQESRFPRAALFRWALLAPLMALLLFLLPVFLLQIYFSFHSWTIYLSSWWNAEFVWFQMFREVLSDSRFYWAILRSLIFVFISTPGCFVIGFALALLMQRPFRGHGFLYAFFIIPMLTPPIVIAYTFEMLLYQKGPINGILSMISGMDVNVSWLADPNVAVITLIFLEIWNWTPLAFIIMLAGLASLPSELTEAAQSLGASRWRIFSEIQVPLLRPVIVLVLILRFLESIGEFPKVWALFQGGPGTATETIPVYIYLTTWSYFQISKGAAMSYIVMVMIALIVLLAIRLLRREKKALDEMYRAPERRP